MLNILTHKIAEDYTDNIVNVDSFFNVYGNINIEDPRVIRVLHTLEGGEFISKDVFKTRFGWNCEIDMIPTGTKAVLLLLTFPERAINFNEIGNNHLEYCHIDNQRDSIEVYEL